MYNPVDAILARPRTSALAERGGDAHLADAIWAYHHADWYVDEVLVLALRYGSDGVAGLAGPAPVDIAALVNRPSLILTPRGEGRPPRRGGRPPPS